MTTNLPHTMKAAVMHRTREIQLEELPVPGIRSNEVLIKVVAVGVCGSDLHYYAHGRIGKYVVDKPFILGHECSGDIAAVGSNVRRLKVGDRVAVEPGVTCGYCDACKKGRYNLCPEVEFLATPPFDGAFTQYIKVRQDFVFKIPDSMSYEEAALIEPFSVGIHAAVRTRLQPDSAIAIVGMGPVGLLAIAAAKAYGASTIIAADLEPLRLEAAHRMGATHVINIREQDPVKGILRITGDKGVDVAWETAGNPAALQAALLSLRRGGKLAIVGLPAQEGISLNVPFMVDHEVDLYGVFRYANTYPKGIHFLSSGIVDTSILITDRYPLERTQEAMERALNHKSECLKVVVYPNGLTVSG
nr:NAD(P)-dependent alcohol dehydrogenase [Cohnella sp. YIM B05605]